MPWRARAWLQPHSVKIRLALSVDLLDELEWREPSIEADLPVGGTRLRRPAGGYRFTLLNGVLTQERGELTGERPGGPLPVE